VRTRSRTPWAEIFTWAGNPGLMSGAGFRSRFGDDSCCNPTWTAKLGRGGNLLCWRPQLLNPPASRKSGSRFRATVASLMNFPAHSVLSRREGHLADLDHQFPEFWGLFASISVRARWPLSFCCNWVRVLGVGDGFQRDLRGYFGDNKRRFFRREKS